MGCHTSLCHRWAAPVHLRCVPLVDGVPGVDVTLVSPLHADGTGWAGAADNPDALQRADKDKDCIAILQFCGVRNRYCVEFIYSAALKSSRRQSDWHTSLLDSGFICVAVHDPTLLNWKKIFSPHVTHATYIALIAQLHIPDHQIDQTLWIYLLLRLLWSWTGSQNLQTHPQTQH